jgi:hypothetical protein
MEQKWQKTTIRELDHILGSTMSGVEHETSLEEQNSKIAGERSQHGDDDHSSHSPRVRAAIDAGRTQRELTHVPRMSAAAGVLKALKRPTQEATSGSGKKTRMSTENRARPSDAHKMPSSVRIRSEQVCSSPLPFHTNKA